MVETGYAEWQGGEVSISKAGMHGRTWYYGPKPGPMRAFNKLAQEEQKDYVGETLY